MLSAATATAQPNHTSLVQPLYTPLTLGSIKPQGWLKDQLELGANGLGGNMFEFYRFVHNSRWIGGEDEYSGLAEASPYWFNGVVPLAFGLDDDRLKDQVRYYLDYVLDHQQEDGWLGFETTPQERGLWGRCLLLLGLIQYAEADPTQTDRIVDAMHRYVRIAHSMLQNNFTGLIQHPGDTFDASGFGAGRTHELHIPLQWLYEKYPRNNSRLLWETMDLMIAGGIKAEADWRTFWVPDAYPKALKGDDWDMSWVFIHGVNMAQGMHLCLRYPLAVYRNTHEEKLKTQTRTALDLLSQYHTSLAGAIIADEYITDLSPTKGSELCIAAEMMFSLNWIYQYLGDNDIADWAELVAFNALPAAISPDWWAHQYVQQENQPYAHPVDPEVWTINGPRANIFGLEPEYPCCLVNHPQAYPKFLANQFVRIAEGLAHIYLTPGTVSTTLDKNNQVSISVDTQYPFAFNWTYTITNSHAFPFSIRIPSWAGPESRIQINRQSPKPLSPSRQGLHTISIPASSSPTTITLTLATTPRVITLPNNTAAIYYGPLLFALAVSNSPTKSPPIDYTNINTTLPTNTTSPGHTFDITLHPTSPWNVAIDPSQIEIVSKKVDRLQNPIWDLGAPPIELRVAAVQIDWPVKYGTADEPPVDVNVTGKPFSARFVPYASAKLHMARLPVVKLERVDLRG
ncbi:uncharacterized protein LDX57_001665 [Aspergillus melleus]|uniref:uncharacterized protein n=1 Tax=Aspergillus melleus TaxID=138277 RepID=UPI001E8CEDB3|nr:uncharacterized protein LDX57_001665 [Aspergillus melleus]KAH8423913.1 hypothetical protein LDX57_001665 [Aspergillus melleus]